MSEWLGSQNKLSTNIRQLLQKRIEKTNPRRKLTSEEAKRLTKQDEVITKPKSRSMVA
jgi:hypothetical protein